MALSDLTAAKESAEVRLAAVMAELAALDGTKAGGLPDGPSGVGHQGYKAGLLNEAKTLQESIASLKQMISDNDSDGGLFEIVSEAEY